MKEMKNGVKFMLWNCKVVSVKETLDGGFIALATINGAYDILLWKTDDNGNLEWNQEFGGQKEIGPQK